MSGHEHHHHNHPAGHHHHHHTELYFSLAAGLVTGLGFALSFFPAIPEYVSTGFYLVAFFFGGYYTLKEAITAILKRQFEIDFLMLVAAVGAAILGKWLEGALLLFLFSLGHALEHYAMDKARTSINALTALTPKTALLRKGDTVHEVPIGDLRIGDTVIVKPDTNIPADGIVVAGTSTVNQAPITGESIPVDKSPVSTGIGSSPGPADGRHQVFAGTINGNGLLEIQVSRLAADSTLSRLVKLVKEAQSQKSPTQLFTDKIERIYVPTVLVLVVLLCFAFVVADEAAGQSFYRAMAVLVAASPCALAISTPSAVLSGVARAAHAGVLIKGGRPLEDLGTLTTLAFDKTGTLTEGKPRLIAVQPFNNNLTETELLKLVVAMENLSDHPIAKAIVRDGKEILGDSPLPNATDLRSAPGKGISVHVDGRTYYAGNLQLFEQLEVIKPGNDLIMQVEKAEASGQTTLLVGNEQTILGMLTVMDTPRKEAAAALEALKETGIRKMVLLSGDNQKVADAVAQQVGITEARGNVLPDQKLDLIRQLLDTDKKVAMVGDGVNDAPAMANSTVGIAMGAAGSDVALETADIALMGDQLSLLPFAIGLSRKAKSIIRQNLVISLGMVAILIPATIFGCAGIGPAVLAHEGSTLIVVFNALRLLAYKKC